MNNQDFKQLEWTLMLQDLRTRGFWFRLAVVVLAGIRSWVRRMGRK